ncbi:Lycopene beta and epsilon cyclase [Oscillochloris trichoides DG-6]|uniref:Lycopene beta and epsilon cyclase n=1 Tax=Oscillochloris trichoides DG-6 TaxID=765420 RepID=E1I9N8_9CHLR|nr:lycopene cyclase family protein [Oscillochloris trichoides]EFO82116.1 Lycopene beta and epsilon cyclase [Oscillochloris trichoides DG-6]
MDTQHYDVIIAGGGAAGLSLAYQMISSPLRDCSILLIDSGTKTQSDRTWAFWTDTPTPFEPIVYHSWDYLHLADDAREQRLDLKDYRYQVIRGIDFYRFVHAALDACPNVTRVQGCVAQIEDGPDVARVVCGEQVYQATWVFDSIFRPTQVPEDERYQYLQLHFKGWEIETNADVFHPDAATLMDFRTPQEGETRFFYVLPFSSRRALVEFTVFSDTRFSHEAYAQALQEYVTEVLQVAEYRIVDEEQGVIPATDHPFPRQIGQRVMAIGTKGGRVKPTTGYAFVRIQRDSAAIITSLLTHGHPFAVPSDSQRYRLLDAVMLELMDHYGQQLKPIFAQMFARNPIERILRFLDEEGSPIENLQLIATLPPWNFIQAAVQWQLSHNTPIRPFIQPLPDPHPEHYDTEGDSWLNVAARMF